MPTRAAIAKFGSLGHIRTMFLSVLGAIFVLLSCICFSTASCGMIEFNCLALNLPNMVKVPSSYANGIID